MKKFLLVVLTVLLAILTVASCAHAQQATPDVQSDSAASAELQDFVRQLCELNAGGVKTGNFSDTRDFIEQKFREALGEDAQLSAAESNVQQEHFSVEGKSYWNIVARLVKEGATKQIVIGAHFDSTYGEGAADNAVGIAALYSTMKQLAAHANDLPFNITFVAFDGEEQGLLGSSKFVENLNNKGQLANTLVMFNIDSIALGDNLYLMCENKHTDLADAILASSKGIVEKPYARGTYGSYLDVFGYGYYETVQGSDHTPFRLAGVPIAFFFSGTYSAEPWGYSESSNKSLQVINTSADTFDNLTNSGVDYVSRIQTVASAITQTVLGEGFTQIAENARSQLVNLNFWYNKWWASLVILAVLIVLAVLTWLYYRKLQKKALIDRPEAKTQKVFEKPDASEIFTFGNGSDKSDIDDIFTFKK